MRPPLSGALGRAAQSPGAHGAASVRTGAGECPQMTRQAGLRYYLHDGASAFRFKLAGALTGNDVAELGQCWTTASSTLGSREFLVDIDEVRFVDEQGHELLRQWHG